MATVLQMCCGMCCSTPQQAPRQQCAAPCCGPYEVGPAAQHIWWPCESRKENDRAAAAHRRVRACPAPTLHTFGSTRRTGLRPHQAGGAGARPGSKTERRAR
jgi:hypothetical protein